MSEPPRARELRMIRCNACALVCDESSRVCHRCGAALHRRKLRGTGRAWAFLLAGAILYIPANVLPVMYTGSLGSGDENTILSGVVDFWQQGEWDIALLIFVASVAVPCTKFLVLALLLVTVRWRNDWARRERTHLYRLVEHIGYWSMLDVLVVALIVALVQFKALSTIEPRIGILFFGAVVVLTMLSTLSFDPRLIWDDEIDYAADA